MRFRPEQHLRSQAEIRAVRERGKRVDCGAFTLWWLARPENSGEAMPPGPRLCVVASIAAVGKAVQRVRAKRRLRELFRAHQSNIAPGLDLMLVARRSAITMPYAELERRFSQACQRLPAQAHV